MKHFFRSAMWITFVLFLVGCGPAGSLFPLFVESDKDFDEQLLGKWQVQDADSFKHGEKSGRMVFRKGLRNAEYEVTLYDFTDDRTILDTAARLVRLGDFLFIDFGTPRSEKRKLREARFPAIESHMFGRIFLEKGGVRIDLLKDDWITEQSKAGKLRLGTIHTAGGLVISASTEELRKFALEHAQDTEAFSEHYALSRAK